MNDRIAIELRCSKTPDGKYHAKTFINGKEQKGKEFSVHRSTDFAVVQLYQRLKNEHAASEIQVKGLDPQSLQKIFQWKK